MVISKKNTTYKWYVVGSLVLQAGFLMVQSDPIQILTGYLLSCERYQIIR